MKGIQNKIMRTNLWKMSMSFRNVIKNSGNTLSKLLPKLAKNFGKCEKFQLNSGPRKTSHVGQARAGQEVRKWLGRKCERPRAREKDFNAYCHA